MMDEFGTPAVRARRRVASARVGPKHAKSADGRPRSHPSESHAVSPMTARHLLVTALLLVCAAAMRTPAMSRMHGRPKNPGARARRLSSPDQELHAADAPRPEDAIEGFFALGSRGYCRVSDRLHTPFGRHYGVGSAADCQMLCADDPACLAAAYDYEWRHCEPMCRETSALCPDGCGINCAPPDSTCFAETDDRRRP